MLVRVRAYRHVCLLFYVLATSKAISGGYRLVTIRYMGLFIYVCMYVGMHMCMYVYRYVCINVCMYACTYMHACMYVPMYICMYVPMYIRNIMRYMSIN